MHTVLDEIYEKLNKNPQSWTLTTSEPAGSPIKYLEGNELITAKKKLNNSTILVIPDSHVRADDNFERFIALDKLIIERKPDYIVQLGDFLGLSCLSGWDKNNKLKMEGARYKSEIESGNKAIDLMFASTMRSKTYNPTIVWCFGNHDQTWVERYLEQNPTLAGHIDIQEDLKLKQRGITNIVPYKKYYEINGILFTHAPQNAANTPVGGKFAAQKAGDLVSKSLVYGHTHSAQLYSCQRHGDDKLINIYVAGAFFEPDNIEQYAEGGTMPHWFGISILNNYEEGQFDVEQISLDRLKAKYL
jgi:predicted phosphodiesterase